jgi:F-type H+-transporting ATPase subunit b
MKKLLLAALLAAPALAFAQPTDQAPAPAAADQAPAPAAPVDQAPTAPPQDQVAPNEAPAAHAPTAPAVGGESAEVQRLTHEAAELEEQPHDPTAHFNYLNFDFRGKDEFGGKFGDGQMVDEKTGHVVKEEEPMSAPFILMLVNFAILLFILAKFGGPVARKTAQERHDQIKTALDEAAKLREQAAQKLAEYENRIKDVDKEVKAIVDGIRADAESDKKRILEAATTQAAQMKRDAEIRIAAEIEYARKALQKEVTVAAAGATEKLLKEKVTGDDQNKLVSTFISNMSTGKEAR